MLVLNRIRSICLSKNILRKGSYSTVTNTAKVAKTAANTAAGETSKTDDSNGGMSTTQTTRTSSPLVAAAFESLKSDNGHASKSKPSKADASFDEKVINAKTVDGLLTITEEYSSQLTRRHALKVVSILSEWSSINRVQLAEFENDTRFTRLCRLLGRAVTKNNSGHNSNTVGNNSKVSGFRTDDLNTVLGIAGDDEAAKLIASISLPQMVKVMTTLAQKKRRSTPLLRSLAFNISSASEPLDLKQCADLLFAMAVLNFPDSVMTAKICADIQVMLPKNENRPAAVGSILTSMGLLKYRDLDVLELLVDWVVKRVEICRPQDIASMFLTLGTLNFKSPNVEQIKKLSDLLNEADFPKLVDWLSYVWALTLLNFAQAKHLERVLSQNFIDALKLTEKTGLTPTLKMKLLNINAYGKYVLDGYKGPSLKADSEVFSVPLAHNKSKQVLVNGMLDALKSLLPSNTHVKSLDDTKMGFVIDAHCVLDGKRNPLPVDKEHGNANKVAIMTVDFHDMCHGTHRSMNGVTCLCFELLEKCGYRVLSVPFNEFNTGDKLLKRVQYLETKFKSIVSPKN